MSSGEHVCYFQMIQGGMACACGEIIKAAKPDLPAFLRAADEAMKAEGIPSPLRQRIINRLIYGDPRGYVAREPAPSEQQVTVHLSGPALDAQVSALTGALARRQRSNGKPFRW